MAEVTKEKLNSVTHSVRTSQVAIQYGVGAIMDFPDQALTTAAPEHWGRTREIRDERLAKALGVDHFGVPEDVAYVRFPEWYTCPQCRRLKPLKEWVAEYRAEGNKKVVEKDGNMVKHLKCPSCKKDLIVARLITICEHGHMSDFPWIEWAHRRGNKPICKNPKLKFLSTDFSTEGIEGLSVKCEECKAQASLKGVFTSDIFKELDTKHSEHTFMCKGEHHHKHEKENCTLYPKAVQRGASSVYFPVVYSSIVIPQYEDQLTEDIRNNQIFNTAETILSYGTPEDKESSLQRFFENWVTDISMSVGAHSEKVRQILYKEWTSPSKIDALSVQYRAEEYDALCGKTSIDGNNQEFYREIMNTDSYGIPHIKSISLVHRVRVVKALLGFSRINPVYKKDDPGFVYIKEPRTNWYPAYEVHGEGIFIALDGGDITKWGESTPEVVKRAEQIDINYKKSPMGERHTRSITPKFILLHTIAHLLIRQLSFECGYNIASLSERIYCADEQDGKDMAGILIYTANGDAEGTLGGLVRQGHTDIFPRIFRRAIDYAKSCSNDPICIMGSGKWVGSLNLAACHTCVLLPETCCEENNSFLDRGLVIGTFKSPDIGFYSKL
jgi:hypothetical protein